ncbi:Do family serine endopeptidase [Luteimonas sp. MC1750]|uniref:Do family serine endopeptidase n=1 Tax=Luteimonas sp. MC1750 TaxID=2799326 RepID=UPI0018F0C1CE|nr:Do family serine endopeptidase [Luteimonas sp. MC1750]MBJ6983146.1 Do family serine endopeptidase [Luteimonas sp. MC1750]QQO05147.1 Do family serine endopeptidase [Luteimonas sp. MC1750]
MKSPVFAVALVALTAAGTAAVVLPAATAQSSQGQATSAAPAVPLVTGLPDFTRLVDRVAPAVVNIEVTVGPRGNRQAQQQLPDDMPEFFRRFFGPGSPFPGTPQDPGGRGGLSMGSGFLVSADGYVITNHHVVDGATAVRVTLPDRRGFDADVVGSDEQSDVAVLKIDASGLPFLRAGRANDVKPGQWAVAIGSPFGLDQSVTAGIVSAVGRANQYANQRYVPFIQTDVAINRGNSGGPLLNTSGEVIGINSQIFSNSGGYMGVSFAIPIDVVMNVADQLKATGQVRRGQMGVQVQEIRADAAQGLGLPDTRGALVADVVAGGAAAKAGIERGDVIREVDGVAISQSSDLPPMIGAKAPGSRVAVKIWREGRTRDVTVTLSELDEGLAAGPRAPSTGAPAARSSNPLGVVGSELSAEQRRRLDLKPDEGVAVARVEGLAARSAGIQPGDVILQVGRANVATPAELDRELGKAKAGETVMLLVRNRSGGTQFIAVTPRDESK